MTPLTNDIDLFAGPGGWDQGIAELGIRPLGIEIDADACATARAAGHFRLQADIAELDPQDVVDTYLDPDPVRGLIASPPCQGFSMAGKGRGRQDAELLLEAIGKMAELPFWAVRGWLRPQVADLRSLLVLEPLRWALALGPEWMAWEQVPAVLPIWEACAEVLRAVGYTVATGVVNAEQYGVPQTRRRAILVARSPRKSHELGPAELPEPTHSRYHIRTPDKLDPGVRKWVSMAEALGWNPGDLVGFPRRSDGKEEVVLDGVAYRARDLHPADRPAPALTEKARSWQRWAFAGAGEGAEARATCRQRRRQLDEPAHTITGKGTAYWVVDGEGEIEGPWLRAGTNVGSTVRDVTQPAPTIHYGPKLNTVTWEAERPPTREELEAAGLKAPPSGPSPTRRRVDIDEAGVLQSFPADYPWSGSRTSQYHQVGNAVPPTLSRAIVAEVSALAAPAGESVVA